MKGNSNSLGSEQEIVEDFEEARKRENEFEKQRIERSNKCLSTEAKRTFIKVGLWAEKLWNKGIKEGSGIRFEVITKQDSKEKQICIKPKLKSEIHDIVYITKKNACTSKKVKHDLDSWFLDYHDDDNPTEKFDLEINDDSVILKADISEYHDKCSAVIKKMFDQEPAEKESVSSEATV
jgi:hypothetical protein